MTDCVTVRDIIDIIKKAKKLGKILKKIQSLFTSMMYLSSSIVESERKSCMDQVDLTKLYLMTRRE